MSRRYFRQQMARDRAVRNMGALRGMSSKETYLRGIGQGVIFLLIGLVILGLNIQNAGKPSFIADLQALPAWVWGLGGGIGSFGFCWTIKNAWQFASLVKPGGRASEGASTPDKTLPQA